MIIKYNCTKFLRRTLTIADADARFLVHSVIPQVPFTFEFERSNCNLVTKLSTDYHSSDLEVSQTAKWQLGDKTVAIKPFDRLFSKSDEW